MVANQALILEIEDRNRADKALRDSERRLSDIIEFLPDATFVIDRDGKVIAWNRSMETMTGIPAKDMLGKGNYEYALPFYGERRPLLVDMVLSADEEIALRYAKIQRRGDVLFGETNSPRLGDRKENIYLAGTAAPLYDSQGNLVGAIESIRDITERKRAEEALRYRDAILEVASFAAETIPEGPLLGDGHPRDPCEARHGHPREPRVHFRKPDIGGGSSSREPAIRVGGGRHQTGDR